MSFFPRGDSAVQRALLCSFLGRHIFDVLPLLPRILMHCVEFCEEYKCALSLLKARKALQSKHYYNHHLNTVSSPEIVMLVQEISNFSIDGKFSGPLLSKSVKVWMTIILISGGQTLFKLKCTCITSVFLCCSQKRCWVTN